MNKLIILLLLFISFPMMIGASSPETVRDGKDYAVFFAIDDYEDHPDFLSLHNPVRDALAIERELSEGYAFETVLHRNPDRATIERVLDSLAGVVFNEHDQLLLFFSGHGDFDKLEKRGTFVPHGYDAGAPKGGAMDLADLRRSVEAVDCSHLLLAIDACYSGLIMTATSLDLNSLEYGGPDNLAETFEEARQMRILELLEDPAKILITSTVDEASSDGGDHSPFTQGILNGLKDGYDYGYGVIDHSFITASISLKTPKSFNDKLAGDGGGQFIFVVANPDYGTEPVATTSLSTARAAEEAWLEARATDDCHAYQEFHSAFPESDFSDLAWKEIRGCNQRKAWEIAKRVDTRDAYREFFIKYPESPYAEVARDKVNNWVEEPTPTPTPGRRPIGLDELRMRNQTEAPGTRPATSATRPGRTRPSTNTSKPGSVRPRPTPSRPSTSRPQPSTSNAAVSGRLPTITAVMAFTTHAEVKGGGYTRDTPPTTVLVGNFLMETAEVTNAEFLAFLNEKGNLQFAGRPAYELNGTNARIRRAGGGKFSIQPGYEQHPVTHVTWFGATAFCNYRSEKSRLKKVYTYHSPNTRVAVDWSANGYRLPTEAEWEYAARSGGKSQVYAGFNSATQIAAYGNICDRMCPTPGRNMHIHDGYPTTAPVRKFKANGLGLYDMTGNVFEWCWDFREDRFQSSRTRNNFSRSGMGAGGQRVIRGGAWNRPVGEGKADFRGGQSPTRGYDNVGFRMARNG